MLYYIANNAIINDNNELNEYRRFSMTNSPSTLQGYLLEDFRLFHLKDLTSRTYSFHHHDFLKIMILHILTWITSNLLIVKMNNPC